jgi:predicted ATPase
LGIPYQLQIHQSSDDLLGDLIVMGLKKKGSDVVVGPSDVGFGIGQLLPIIVQAGLSVNIEGDINCVEQPEIHLHPRLQAEIADLFIETAILPDQYGDMERPQWIVETHSEALILRVQRRIREQVIEPGDVSVLYVEPNPTGGSSINYLRIGEDGEFIDEWPGGFFEETYNETFSGYQE